MKSITADDGDRLLVQACALLEREGIVRIHVHNECHSPEFDWITLSPGKARVLARALLNAAETAEMHPGQLQAA